MKRDRKDEILLGDQVAIVNKLFEQLKDLPPPSPEFKKKLEDKYRLEWNFHSNHIEGNTLTYGQTQLLLFKGKATGDHEKQDYDEMEAHDVAIEMIKEWAKDKNRDITEADLRELNKIILVRPFWKEAITPDGQSTRKKIVPGSYKTTPNSVRLKSGQIHNYASPEETPALMEDLMKWYNGNGKSLKPLLRAAVVHHEFTKIHPFDDGNGRVARLWANFILLQAGYPPLIIRTENKEKYLTALQKADIGELESFVDYLSEELQWSIELSIKAAKGESIEEPHDIDKEIAVLKRQLKSKNDSIIHKNLSTSLEIYKSSIRPLISAVHTKLEQFDDLFAKKDIAISVNNRQKKNQDLFQFIDNRYKEIEDYLKKNPTKSDSPVIPKRLEINFIMYWLKWGMFLKGKDTFDLIIKLAFKLEYGNYMIFSDDMRILDKRFKNYNEVILQDESDEIARTYAKFVIEVIRKRTN
jgi:Fic family protein